MTLDELTQSVSVDSEPPEGISEELRSLWFARKGKWHESHDIAQEIYTPMGSWIHGLLHTMEGDLGNASYWYSKAGKPAIAANQIDEEWSNIAKALLAGE